MKGFSTRVIIGVLALGMLPGALPAGASASAGSERKPKPTFYSTTRDLIDDSGNPTKTLAIAAFEAAFGDLPGKKVEKVSRRGLDPQTALNLILAVWDDLSQKQQRLVTATIDGERGRFVKAADTVNETTGGPVLGRSAPRQQAIDRANIGAAILRLRDELGRRLAAGMGAPAGAERNVQIRVGEWNASSGVCAGDPSPCRLTLGNERTIIFARFGAVVDERGRYAPFNDTDRGNPNICTLLIHEGQRARGPHPVPEPVLADAVFECLDFWLRQAVSRQREILCTCPMWLWAGRIAIKIHETRVLGGPSFLFDFGRWLTQPTRPVYDYDYSALPYWTLLRQHGADLVAAYGRAIRAKIDQAGGPNTNAAALRASFSGVPGFEGIASVAMARMMLSRLGAQWEHETPPASPQEGFRPLQRDVPTESLDGSRPNRQLPLEVTLAGTATATFELAIRNADVLQVTVGGAAIEARLGFEGSRTVRLTTGRTVVCLTSCVCPFGGPTFAAGRAGRIGLAIANTNLDASVRSRALTHMRILTLEQVCSTAPVVTIPLTEDDVMPPVLSKLSASPDEISEVQCPPSEAGISAVAADESGIASVTMSWAFDAGFGQQSGSVEMTRSGESQFSATFGPYDIAVSIDVPISITAVDTYGNPTTELVNVRLSDCPV